MGLIKCGLLFFRRHGQPSYEHKIGFCLRNKTRVLCLRMDGTKREKQLGFFLSGCAESLFFRDGDSAAILTKQEKKFGWPLRHLLRKTLNLIK